MVQIQQGLAVVERNPLGCSAGCWGVVSVDQNSAAIRDPEKACPRSHISFHWGLIRALYGLGDERVVGGSVLAQCLSHNADHMDYPAESSTARVPQLRWELENNLQSGIEVDALFKYDAAEQQVVQQQKPWSKDPHYFKQ